MSDRAIPAGELLDRSPYLFDAGSAFVLAAGGLRRLHGRGEDFLGHAAGDMFWRDVLDLVHDADLPRTMSLISEAVKSPGATLHDSLSLRCAWGEWRRVEVSVRNVVEAPDDGGLVVAYFDDVSPADGRSPDGHSPGGHSPNGHRA